LYCLVMFRLMNNYTGLNVAILSSTLTGILVEENGNV
jgi:hypothetical protein